MVKNREEQVARPGNGPLRMQQAIDIMTLAVDIKKYAATLQVLNLCMKIRTNSRKNLDLREESVKKKKGDDCGTALIIAEDSRGEGN